MKRIQGIYPALLTPFTADGEVNRTALRQLVEMNIRKGVSGFYVCGSTAEAFLLSAGQRKQILETVAEANAGRVQLLAHIGHIDTATAIAKGSAAFGAAGSGAVAGSVSAPVAGSSGVAGSVSAPAAGRETLCQFADHLIGRTF